MKYLNIDDKRSLDLVCLGRLTIDLNPISSEGFKPLKDVHKFEKYVGGSPANIACGITRHGLKAGFIGRVSDDQFGDFVVEYFQKQGIDTSQIKRCQHGEKLGLTFTEMLSSTQSSILMYRNQVADLQLCVDDISEEYIASAKALLISGTSLAASPSREAALKAVMLAKKTKTPIIFDIDYREYNWSSKDEISIYYSMVAKEADIIMGSREEFDLTERLIQIGNTDHQSAEYWLHQNAKVVVIKHGKKGSNAYLTNGESHAIKPFPVNSRKGFGGGDGYASAFLYGVFKEWNLLKCLEYASAQASMMVRSNNCSVDLPTIEEVKSFILEEKRKYGEDVVDCKENELCQD